MVGSVSTEMNGRFFSRSKCSDALVLVICISDVRPSCIRAPPEAATQIKEQPSAAARRTPCTKRSPTTEPIEPPIKRNSNAATTTGWPCNSPFITTNASSSPVALRAALKRSGYFLLSLNFKISVGFTAAPISSRFSLSSSISSRSRAVMASWCPHFGQTLWFCSTSVAYCVAPQEAHLRHKPSGMPDFPSVFLIFGGRILSNQLITFLCARKLQKKQPAPVFLKFIY